jgi:CRISPR-associated protein Cmr3
MMHDYLIVPQSPLVFRSGRPFGAGSRDGANFPWPSSVAGMLRTQAMDERGWRPKLTEEQREELLALAAAGPILARREGGRVMPMLPKPADALLLLEKKGDDERKRYFRLRPGALPAGCGCDLPQGLLPLVLATEHKGKPQDGPAFWPLDELLRWRVGEEVAFFEPDEPKPESRTHVAIDRESFAADSGRLFQTEGLDFSRRRRPNHRGFESTDWVYLCRFAEAPGPRMVAFGGERRQSWLDKAEGAPLAAPDEYVKSVMATRRIALTLATPALFTRGWKPAWADSGQDVPGIPGLRLRLKAAAVERWLGISGWDLHAGGAKPARKAVAAGATYWFEVEGEPPAGWAQRLWLAPLSDAPQDRMDGFGLVVPGPWNND